MIKNQEFVDFVLKTLKDPFNFAGEVKYYPGRALDESSALFFPTNPVFMNFLRDHVPLSQEYVVLARTPRELGFCLKDEKMMFTQSASGIFKISHYEDPLNLRVEDPTIYADALREELKAFLKDNSIGNNGPKKLAS